MYLPDIRLITNTDLQDSMLHSMLDSSVNLGLLNQMVNQSTIVVHVE